MLTFFLQFFANYWREGKKIRTIYLVVFEDRRNFVIYLMPKVPRGCYVDRKSNELYTIYILNRKQLRNSR